LVNLLIYARFRSNTAAAPMTAMITTAAPTISKVSVGKSLSGSTAGVGDTGAVVIGGDCVGMPLCVGATLEVGWVVGCADAEPTVIYVVA